MPLEHNQKQNQMSTTADLQTYTLQIPQSDVRFLSVIAKKMGWTKKKAIARKTGLDMALDDVREGRVYKAKDVDDLIRQLEM